MRKLTIVIAILIFLPTGKVFSSDTLKIRDIDSAIVTAIKIPVKRSLVPNSVNIVNSEKLEASVNSALLPTLGREVPGLFVTQRGVTGFGVSEGSAGVVNIRGIGQGNKVLLMLDGQPQFAGIFGHALPDLYVESDAERVEVVRGPGSIVYGSNAAAGVVNVITHRHPEQGLRLTGRFMYGSYNTQKYMISTGFSKNRFSLFASFNHDRTEGHRENSLFKITNGYLKSVYKIDENFKLTGDISVAKTISQNPGRIDKPVFDNTMDILRGNASLTLENSFGRFSGALKGFYGYGDHFINDGYFEGESPREMMFKSIDHNSGVMLYQSYSGPLGTTVTVGADFKSWGGRASNIPVAESSAIPLLLVDKSVSELAAYAIAQQKLFKVLTVNGGVRYEYNSTFGGELVPQAGASLNLTEGNTIKYIFSKGFRSPNIREMYMFPPQNPNLLPERFFNNEISVMQSFMGGRITVEASLYIITGENLIQVAFVDGKPKNVNIGEVNNRGVEFDFMAEIVQNFSLTANYSYLHMRNPVPAAPENMFNAMLLYSPGKFRFSAGIQTISNLYLTTGPNPQKESYTLVNASASYNGKAKWFDYTLFLKGENLTGANYSINVGFPMPGATVSAGVSFTIPTQL